MAATVANTVVSDGIMMMVRKWDGCVCNRSWTYEG